MTPTQRLRAIEEIIEDVDNRCMAVDGPVSKTREEITDAEIRQIYKLASWKPKRRKRERRTPQASPAHS